MPASKEQNEWVERVLGLRVAQAAPPQTVPPALAALTEKSAKLAVARPSAAPRQQATNRVLNAIATKPVPEDAADVPAHVADFIPGFLVAMEAERPVVSQKLQEGAPVSGPDQLLGIADLFAATQRSLTEWENLLDQAEAADRTVDVIEEQETERDEQEYTTSLTAYNARRNDSITAEARATKLMLELQAKFESLSESAQAAALKEAGNA